MTIPRDILRRALREVKARQHVVRAGVETMSPSYSGRNKISGAPTTGDQSFVHVKAVVET